MRRFVLKKLKERGKKDESDYANNRNEEKV